MVEVVRLIRSHSKGRQFDLCPSRILPGAGGLPQILPGAGAEGQHPTVGRTEPRMGVRLLGRAMLGQTTVAAIIYGFVGTNWTTLPNRLLGTDWTTLPNRLHPGPKFSS